MSPSPSTSVPAKWHLWSFCYDPTFGYHVSSFAIYRSVYVLSSSDSNLRSALYFKSPIELRVQSFLDMMSESKRHFTEFTTTYWQNILPPSAKTASPPYQYSYAATLPDERVLLLPIRQLEADASQGVASLIINQASLSVTETLGNFLADAVRGLDIEVVVGLPTLGLSLAPIVARVLGYERYIPLGYSHKFWYTKSLSTSSTSTSVTSPTQQKTLFLDPNLLPLVHGRKVLIVDDAISSGRTLKTAWDFLESENLQCQVVGAGVVMKQGERWRSVIDELATDGRRTATRSEEVRWVFESPLLAMVDGGWVVRT